MKEDLLKIAREKYPVGTKFKIAHLPHITSYVKHSNYYWGKSNNIYCASKENVIDEDGINGCLYCDGEWAEIISDNMYKGQIEGFPPEIVEKMLYYQEKQGNERNVTVFEENNIRSFAFKGFSWKNTKEGDDFWQNIICRKNFDLFFEKYPKLNVVCGVELEQGKDYYVEFGKNTYISITRYKGIDNSTRNLLGEYSILFSKKNNHLLIKDDKGLRCVDSIKSIRIATPEESEHLSQCIAANKYVEMKQYEYEVVHCETEEQWNFVTEKKHYKWLYGTCWNMYEKNTCIRLNGCDSASKSYYEKHNSKIYSFSDWCTKFNHQFEEFKVGDWVCATGTGHTKNNPSFPKDVAWKIGDISPMKSGWNDSIWVDKKDNPNKVKGGCTNKNDIRKALPHEIPQSEFKTLVAGQGVSVDTRYNEIEINYALGDKDLMSEQSIGRVDRKSITKGLVVRTIEPKQVKEEIKLVPIKLNNHSRLIIK